MANNLKLLREDRGLTMRQLANKTYTTDAAISKIENGQQAMSEQYARIFADFFGVSIDYLLCRAEIPNMSVPQVIYKTTEITYGGIVTKLKDLTNAELSKLAGIIEYIIQERSKPLPNNQAIKNEVDKAASKKLS